MHCYKSKSQVWRKNCKFAALIVYKRKLNVVLSDGKTKRIAGYAKFDMSVALNLNMR